MTVEEMLKDAGSTNLQEEQMKIVNALGDDLAKVIRTAAEAMATLYEGQPWQDYKAPALSILTMSVLESAHRAAELLAPLSIELSENKKFSERRFEAIAGGYATAIDSLMAIHISSGIARGLHDSGHAASAGTMLPPHIESIVGRELTEKERKDLLAFRAADDVRGAADYIIKITRNG